MRVAPYWSEPGSSDLHGRRRPVLKTATVLALVFAASPNAAHAQETKASYGRDLITQAEIQDRAPDATNAYEVVTRLRPHFLRERSSGTTPNSMTTGGNRTVQAERQPVVVYVNGAKSNVPTVSLREIHSTSVIEILYLNASDATTRYGTGHNNGAILVKTGT